MKVKVTRLISAGDNSKIVAKIPISGGCHRNISKGVPVCAGYLLMQVKTPHGLRSKELSKRVFSTGTVVWKP